MQLTLTKIIRIARGILLRTNFSNDSTYDVNRDIQLLTYLRHHELINRSNKMQFDDNIPDHLQQLRRKGLIDLLRKLNFHDVALRDAHRINKRIQQCNPQNMHYYKSFLNKKTFKLFIHAFGTFFYNTNSRQKQVDIIRIQSNQNQIETLQQDTKDLNLLLNMRQMLTITNKTTITKQVTHNTLKIHKLRK